MNTPYRPLVGELMARYSPDVSESWCEYCGTTGKCAVCGSDHSDIGDIEALADTLTPGEESLWDAITGFREPFAEEWWEEHSVAVRAAVGRFLGDLREGRYKDGLTRS